jgi:hypothetical protein
VHRRGAPPSRRLDPGVEKHNDEIEAEDAALRRDFETYKAAHP